MPTEIDSLQISINAKAQTANRQIDALVGRLDILQKSLGKLNGGSSNLVGVANGVDRLGKAMQTMNAVKTADFTRLASNLAKLGNINVSALNSTASSLTHLTRSFSNIGSVSQNAVHVSELAKNLGKLGGKSVTNAITNIPQLANALRKLMTTLAKSPVVSQNIIQMTNALANLSAQSGKIGRVTKSISSNLNTASSSATRAGVRFRSLAAIFGTFYANAFLFIRGIKGIYNAINSTADYLEAYNYFNVALGKIGSDWSEQYEQYGYESAEVYAESFSQRLQNRIKKMSGLTIEVDAQGKGLLTASGLKNLGLNIQEVTQYASQLASVTNSVGQMGEVSLATASSLTKLGADLSSLFNINYADVMKNLQSGLIGQSRALYKYGIDITNATLQTLAYELGLTKSVSEMSQMEKMQLRLIKILRDSKVSWGDLANTINSPSNMMRQFANNAKELGMVFGQLFIPLLQKIMPVLNGVTIALKNLLVTVATFLGINLNLDDFGQGFSDLGEDAEDIADGYGKATNAIKKFKGQLLGIDELNVLNSGNDASGGAGGVAQNTIDLTEDILKATEEYEKAWEEAYAKMKNKAEDIAKKIDKILEPVKNVFKNLFDGEYYKAGQGFGEIASDIFNWLSDEIEKVDWDKIGMNIGEFIAGIDWIKVLYSVGRLIWTAIQASLRVWAGSFSAAPIETGLLTAFSVLNFTPLGKLIASKIGASISKAVASIGGFGALFTTDLGMIFGAGTALEIGVTIASGIIGGILAAIGGFEIGKIIGKALFPEDMEYYNNFKWFGKGGFFGTIFEDLEATLFSVITMWKDFSFMGLLLDAIFGKENTALVDQKILDAFGKDGFKGIYDMFVESLTKIKDYIGDWINKKISPMFTKEKWEKILKGFKDGFVAGFTLPIKIVIGRMNTFIEGLEKMINFAIKGLNLLIDAINPLSGVLDFVGIDIKIKDVSLGRIPLPQYKYGGFPEDGLFMANHGELVGGFSNGKTAVANNGQIIEGIEGGVERAVSRVLAPYLEDIAQNTRETANKDFSISRKQVFNAVREESRIFKKSTGAPAFS